MSFFHFTIYPGDAAGFYAVFLFSDWFSISLFTTESCKLPKPTEVHTHVALLKCYARKTNRLQSFQNCVEEEIKIKSSWQHCLKSTLFSGKVSWWQRIFNCHSWAVVAPLPQLWKHKEDVFSFPNAFMQKGNIKQISILLNLLSLSADFFI